MFKRSWGLLTSAAGAVRAPFINTVKAVWAGLTLAALVLGGVGFGAGWYLGYEDGREIPKAATAAHAAALADREAAMTRVSTLEGLLATAGKTILAHEATIRALKDQPSTVASPLPKKPVSKPAPKPVVKPSWIW